MIHKNKRPDKVSLSNIYSIENIKNYIKINNISTRLLSTEYIGSYNKMKWECVCGNIFEESWSKFNQGYNICPECKKRLVFENRKQKKKDVILSWCRENDYKLLDLSYDDNYCFESFSIEDEEGYRYILKYNNYTKFKPLKFHTSNIYTIYNINRWLNILGLCDYVCISTSYVNNNTKLKFIHLDCMKTFCLTLGKFQRKISENGLYICPNCFKKKIESYHASVLKQIFMHEYKNVIVEDRSCINKETGYALPTDIVCYDTKEVVEIQSSYHDVEYKIKLDLYKKNYWENRGFKVHTPDIRDYKIIEMVQLFFPYIKEIPSYINVKYNSCPNYKELQKILDSGVSTNDLSMITGVDVNSIRQYIYKGILKLPDDYKENILNHKKIVQLDKNGNLINTFDTISEADRNGYKSGTIRRVLNGKQEYSYGCIWMYKSDYKIQQCNK